MTKSENNILVTDTK